MILKKTISCIVKVMLSGIIAMIVLTFFCLIYKKGSVHYPDPDGATDHRWEPNSTYIQATEGFSWGKTNNEGYCNIRNYYPKDEIDILIMGSSQMEASNVMMEDSTAVLLDEKLTDQVVYNIGVSGHYLLNCACNLENALKKYKPKFFVIMQTDTLRFSSVELKKALTGSIAKYTSNNDGIIGFLQKNPFLRLVYHQLQNYMDEKNQKDDMSKGDSPIIKENSIQEETELLMQLIKKMNDKVSEYNARLIILYHPSTSLYEDGSLKPDKNAEISKMIKQMCNDHNILFLDMGRRFEEEYKMNNVLPYGFANTSVGSGHLNKIGHAMIAEELFNLIQEAR